MSGVGHGWRPPRGGRHGEILRAAAGLFARKGFVAVSTSELGEAVGVSGPAIYKHFASKDAVLAELLVGASESLLEGCRSLLADAPDDGPEEVLSSLVAFHADFATREPDIIRIQDRELSQLAPGVNRTVRRLQRAYVAEWDGLLAAARPALDADERETRLLATFGLLNSTPFSAVRTGRRVLPVLTAMAERALLG